jgi:hypothetical protein
MNNISLANETISALKLKKEETVLFYKVIINYCLFTSFLQSPGSKRQFKPSPVNEAQNELPSLDKFIASDQFNKTP